METNPTKNNIKNLEKDPPLRIPDTYVHGIVSRGGNPQTGSLVQLIDASNGNVLTQMTTGADGSYNILICTYNYGDRIVKATYTDKFGNNYRDSERFTFSYATGWPDWDYEIDLSLQQY